MVQRIEHFCPELQLEAFGQFETFADSEIEIPVTRCFKSIASRTVVSGRRYGKRTGVLENDRSDHSWDVLQSNVWFGSDYVGPRLVRKVRCADATAYAEGLTGHERINSVEAPAPHHMVQRRRNRGREAFLFPKGKLPQ